MTEFKKAKVTDAKSLAMVSWHAFDHDVHYGAPGPGGPPGYKSDRWQSKMMRLGDYFKIMIDGRIIGGLIVFRKSAGHYELGRVFIHPDFQDQGIGTQTLHFMEGAYPFTRCWTLGTPRWNKRTRHFYEKNGFIAVGSDGPDGIRYEKRMPNKTREVIT